MADDSVWIAPDGEEALKCISGFVRRADPNLAVWRDAAREWLEEQTNGLTISLSSGGYTVETCDIEENEWTQHADPGDGYDEALVKAVLSVAGRIAIRFIEGIDVGDGPHREG